MASISLSTVADDNKINSVEATTALPLSGTSSGIAAGTLVSIFVDGSTTPAAYSFLNADGSWHAVLDATGLDEGPHTITASVVSASVSSSRNVTVDTIAQSMSITQDDAALSNAGTVHYSVTLSEAISGVTAANFGLATTGTIAGAAVTAVTTSDDIHFSVTVDTGSGDGTIALTTSVIKDGAGNGIAGAAFQPAVTTPANGTVANTFAADLNGDGRIDILSINSTNYETWLQLSDGTFQHNSTSLGVTFYSSALLGDVNGDGILDFLAPTSGGLLTYLGVGDGTFDFASSSNTSAGTLAIYSAAASGDFNGDGKLDVVVTTTRSDDAGNAWVLLGNGDGTFAPAVSYAVGARPTTVGTGDFNHDGKTDIVVVNQYGGTVGILLGNGDGTFQAEVDYAAGVNLPRGLAVGDLNGDGNPDLVIGNFTSGDGLAVLLGNSDGTFQTAVVYATGSYNNAINIGDIDGDGIPDLTVVNGGYNGARGAFLIYRGLGDGTFAGPSDYVALDASGIPMPLAVADINGDGKPDLVTAGYFAAELAILYNAAPPGPAYTLDRTAPDAPSTPDLTAASDSAVDTDNITSVNTPTFNGTAEAGSTVTLYDTNGTTVLGTTTADASTGEWSITTSVLADGDHTITATATDTVGNVSDPSTGLAVKIDTVTPVVAAPDLDAASDTGWSSTDNLTKDNTPTFTGTTEAGATVTLYDTDGITVLGTATADETTGVWSIPRRRSPTAITPSRCKPRTRPAT